MWNMDLSTAQHNGSDQVALCFRTTTNPLVEFGSQTNKTYRAYKFATKHNICLAWVNIEDAPKVLGILGGCCGNKRQPIYRVASETDVRRWTYGTR